MPDMWRLFIALELPAPVITLLKSRQEWLKQHTPSHTVKWVHPNSIHLTLKFLGDVSIHKIDTLKEHLARAAHDQQAFTLATAACGCFPNAQRPRVVWVGLKGDLRALHKVRDAVETYITPLGFPTEDRPFRPHLTLGRVRQDARQQDVRRLGGIIADADFPDEAQWSPTQITLFRSELTPQGALYTALHHVTLP